ncbi:Gfo/Idh/MocA family oxidoreductase [Paenibacillus sp. IB182496]|uniref:Gfo/Idh/MocA family oxidoreductase n=1 Tax=Paenibacillus sabuli TaxID=2772509 RepID=A0A927BXT7_9BACL|nr:Gfo/Idh/MocA family oxidoreductase [Paenibacillus sabuli]MBD2847715.1 Gfo/Idh/MocA family oxidoreductase [Paenibacillus sabuli]
MKKIALVGAGSRALHMFAKPLAEELKPFVDFCGVYDLNRKRAELLSQDCGGIPVYDSFEAMLGEARPDTVVVASTDSTHHEYIVAALQAGCDVISEKPMTTDAAKCEAILKAEQDSGRRVTVTFNLRFAPYFARVKELLDEGAVGRVHHIALQWYLDRRHGADYFRRWHAEMKNSGGLLVHKSTHHFDIINWWLDSRPDSVYANGARQLYGPTREERGERCLTCDYKASCAFYFDVRDQPFTDRYFLQAEQEDGYIRDRCVFSERIDIYDTMSVNVRYDSGAMLTYSLVAYSPNEGWRATITGSDGTMEIANQYSNADMSQAGPSAIRVYKPGGEVRRYDVPTHGSGHGGGDARLRAMLFHPQPAPDLLGQQAGSVAGAYSLLIGDAANRSIAEGRPIQLPVWR